MPWIPIKEKLPIPFKLVALMDSRAYINQGFTESPVPVCKVGYLNDSFGGYWSCYGGRALEITAFTHWARLPDFEGFDCFDSILEKGEKDGSTEARNR